MAQTLKRGQRECTKCHKIVSVHDVEKGQCSECRRPRTEDEQWAELMEDSQGEPLSFRLPGISPENAALMIWRFSEKFADIERAARDCREHGEQLVRYASEERYLTSIYQASEPVELKLRKAIGTMREQQETIHSFLFALGCTKEQCMEFTAYCQRQAFRSTRSYSPSVMNPELEAEYKAKRAAREAKCKTCLDTGKVTRELFGEMVEYPCICEAAN